jgi:uroporphyrinogen-III synthase
VSVAIRVCSFESRRATEIGSLIERMGGLPTVAPSMREIPLTANDHVLQFAERLLKGEFEDILFMTGVGARALWEFLAPHYSQEVIFAELNKRRIIVRGPKPVVVLREWGVHIDYRAPEPNTWREILTMIDQEQIFLQGRAMALQEYGKPNLRLVAGLEERGAKVLSVPVYRWDLPEDIGPLQNAIRQLIAGEFDLVLFTSAQQVYHVLQVAEELDLLEAIKAAMDKIVIASIGPTCTEALVESGFTVALEPSHPKMGHLVKEALAYLESAKS